MSLERKRRVLEILDQALAVKTDEREALVAELCGDDEELRQRVFKLLDDEEASGVLGAPIFDIHGADPGIGRQIGDYRLVELLGRGGMGTVYLAERESFEQRVAVKIIRRGLDLDPVLVQRFHNERQILARLDHPGIARLLDGGTTGDNLPYVVMEYVEGEPIDVHCRRLGLRERLELFCKVCDAVQFAHQNLVVHRDLKPGNILITAGGEPKLLDFGIAKLLDESLDTRPFLTVTGEAPLTPRYASPEQLRREPVVTASDVYVLGVLLFEILTGLPAYEERTDPAELARAVCEDEPMRPSTAVRRRGEDEGEGEDEAVSPQRLRRQLQGDLDSIVLKAMRKEPASRYGSAEQLAEDIRRYLTGLPVRARAGTFSYRAGKFVRRYRLGLSILTAFMLVILGAAVVSTYYFLEAKESNERAEAILIFVKDELFLPSNPNESGRDLTVYELLRRGAWKVLLPGSSTLSDEVRMDLAGTVGDLMYSFGEYEDARQLMNEAYRLAQLTFPPRHPEVAKRLNNLAVVEVALEEYATAANLTRQLLATQTEVGAKEKDLFKFRSNLSMFLKDQGALEEASKIARSVLKRREELYLPVYGPDDKDVATSRHNVAAVDYAKGDFESALDYAQKAFDVRHRDTEREVAAASTQDLLGRILLARGEVDAAIVELEAALAVRQKRLGDDHPDVAETRRHLAEALLERDPTRSEMLLRQALKVFSKRNPDSWRVADADSVLALLEARSGRLEGTASRAFASFERLRDVRGEASTITKQAKARWQKIVSLESQNSE